MRVYLLLIIVLFLSCKEKEHEIIILTSGLSEDTNDPRIGIDIRNNELYYCVENLKLKNTYTYYSCEIDSIVFQGLKKQVRKTFKNVNRDTNVVDAPPYELIYKLDDSSDSIRFYRPLLTESQNNLVDQILSLKRYKLQKITYHSFPTGLLEENLPEPPTL